MALLRKYQLRLMILVLSAALPAAQAALTHLPESAYYSGRTTYSIDLDNGQILSGRIEFAVYDTQANPGEFEGTAPGSGRYLYAYQIFNDSGSSNAAVSQFVIKEIGEGAIPSDNPNSYIGSDDDGALGVDASLAFFNLDRTEGNWAFDTENVSAGAHSAFLLVRSDASPKLGTYDFVQSDDSDVPVPGDDGNGDPIPEPATLVLLTAGGLLSFRKSR